MKKTWAFVASPVLATFILMGLANRGQSQTIINVPPSPSPTSAGADTVVNLLPTGKLSNNFQVLNGGSLNIEGGSAESFRVFGGGNASILNGTAYLGLAENGGVISLLGGELRFLNANNGGVLNIYGGTLIDGLDTNDATVNLWGGSLTDNFRARVGSELTVYATEFHLNGTPVAGLSNPGDSVTIPISPRDYDYLPNGDYLSGVFENGVPFVLGGEEEPFAESVKLVLTAPYTPGPALIQVPSDQAPQGIHSGQTLVLSTGGTLPRNFTASNGSTVLMQGGTVEPNFEAIAATIDMTAGQINTLDAFAGTTVNIGGTATWSGLTVYDGSIANINGGSYTGNNFFRVMKGGEVNVSAGDLNGVFTVDSGTVNILGGTIGTYQQTNFASHGSHVHIAGGVLESDLHVMSGSQLTMTGGSIPAVALSVGDSDLMGKVTSTARIEGGSIERLTVHDEDSSAVMKGGSVDVVSNFGGAMIIEGGALGDRVAWTNGIVEIHGYNFQVDGVPLSGLAQAGDETGFNYTEGTTLSGTLADGTPFNFNSMDTSGYPIEFNGGVVRLIRTEIPDVPTDITVPTSPAPYGVSAGQTLRMEDGGQLRNNFIAGPGSNVEIHGGSVGYNFETDRSQVTVSGGSVGDRWDVFNGATVTATGGTLGKEFEVYAGGTLNIKGGTVGTSGDIRGGTVNISGGELGSGLEAFDGAVVNISGGKTSRDFKVWSGAMVNVSGGEVDINFEVYDGATAKVSGGFLRELDVKSGGIAQVVGGNTDDLNTTSTSGIVVTGGSFGDSFSISGSSVSELHGLGFKVDGVPLAGLESPGSEISFTMASNSLFTGLLSDGTPFAFRSTEGDSIANLKLVRSADLPAPAPIVEVSNDSALGGARTGQTLNLAPGGKLPKNFNAGEGSTLNIQGGTIGDNLEVVAASVNLDTGSIGNGMDAFPGSMITIVGGSVGTNVDAFADSEINILDGFVGHIAAFASSEITVSGGRLNRLQAQAGSHTVWNGGTLPILNASTSATVEIVGADFRIDGIPLSNLDSPGDMLPFDIPADSIMTATLADGTPLVLGPFITGQSTIAAGVLKLVRSDAPSLPLPAEFVVVEQTAPYAVGQGQHLVMESGGQLPNDFIAGKGSSVRIEGGTVLANFKAFDADVVIEGGSIGDNLTALMGTNLTIRGGQIGAGFQIHGGAEVDISGGLLPSQVNINSGAIVNLYGKSFLIGGMPIAELQNAGDSFQITQFNGQFLTAILADDSPLSWRLAQTGSPPRVPLQGISSGAIITLHLVPEPLAVTQFGLLSLILLQFRERSWCCVRAS